ncbi:hypothetical protein V2J09_016159 [Rumex salicifolius]
MENSASSSRLLPKAGIVDPRDAIVKEIRAHEIAIAEMNNLSSSRTVYQRHGNLFFRTTIQKATAVEQSKFGEDEYAMMLPIPSQQMMISSPWMDAGLTIRLFPSHCLLWVYGKE